MAAFLLTACQSYKKVPLTCWVTKVVLYSTQDTQLYDAKIMPKDLLTIVVSCTSPELAAPFNLTVATQNNMALNYVTSLTVQNLGYTATFPTVIKHYNEPTYLDCIKG